MDTLAGLDGFQLQQLALVGVTALLMLSIIVYTVVSSVRRRRAEKAVADARLLVTILIPVSATDEEREERWEDRLDDRLLELGAGVLYDGRSVVSAGIDQVELIARLDGGVAGIAALKTALSRIGAPATTLLTWEQGGVTAKDRLGTIRR